MGEQPGPVEIGLREVYDAVQDLRGLVVALTAQLTARAHQVDDHEVRIRQIEQTRRCDAHSTELADQEQRIRSLERRQWPLPTVALLVSLAAFALDIILRMR